MRLDVRASRELMAVILAMRSVDNTIAKMIRQQTKRVAVPEWTRALARRASSALDRRVMVNTATVAASNQNVRVSSAAKGRPLSGGLNPKTDWHAVEFGANQQQETTYRRRGRNGPHTVTRRTNTGLPARNPRGRIFYPAAREMVPRLASLWVQTVVRTIGNALEGKQE